MVFEGVVAPTEKMWLLKPPGEHLNKKYASLLNRRQRDVMRQWSNSQCIKAYDSLSEYFFEFRELEEDAKGYISDDSEKPRDYTWEEEFSKKYYEARDGSQKAMKHLLICEQWNKALNESYFFQRWAPEDSVKVLRLAESAKAEREKLEKREGRGTKCSGDVGWEVASVANGKYKFTIYQRTSTAGYKTGEKDEGRD